MKKVIAVLAAVCIVAAALCGCAQKNTTNTATNETGEKLQVVTTIFPVYDWIKNVAGDKADVTFLLDSGVDLHSFQPTADDIVKISACDLFVYVGGESDEWAEDAVSTAKNEKMLSLNLMEALGDKAKEEELVEGMQGEEEEEEEGAEEEPEYDEHIWLSLKNAAVLVNAIAVKLSAADSANADYYAQNAKTYVEKINALDKEYETAVAAAQNRTLVFGDRFPFRYMTEDYGLTYYAAFIGCSAETEASFETVRFLADKVDALHLPYIMAIEGTDHSIAETIVKNTSTKDQQVLTLDSMQSTTKEDVDNNASYLDIMNKNLAVLQTALN